MADQWHLLMGDKKHGPYTCEQLKDLVLQGMLQPTSQLLAADGTELVASDFTELWEKPSVDESVADDNTPGDVNNDTNDKDDFKVYSNGEKEPGAFSDILTPRNIMIVVAIIAYLGWVTFVTDWYTDEHEETSKKLRELKYQQQMHQRMQNGDFNPKYNITPDQVGDAMRQSSGY